jgi:hypothetical protein
VLNSSFFLCCFSISITQLRGPNCEEQQHLRNFVYSLQCYHVDDKCGTLRAPLGFIFHGTHESDRTLTSKTDFWKKNRSMRRLTCITTSQTTYTGRYMHTRSSYFTSYFMREKETEFSDLTTMRPNDPTRQSHKTIRPIRNRAKRKS